MLEPAKNKNEKDLPTQIARSLLAYIRSENLAAGDRLPPQTVLADRLNVSRTSLREALARLQTEGLIRQVHGVGTFVGEDPTTIHSSADISLSITEMLLAQGIQPATSEIELEWIPHKNIPPQTVQCLNIKPEQRVLCLRWVRTADGTPFAYVIAYLVENLPNLSSDPDAYSGSLYLYLETQCDEFITETNSEIEACITNESLSSRLGIPAGSPLLLLRQCHFNAEGRALIHSIDYFIQNRMRLNVHRQRSGHVFLKEVK